jgi:hypothetical protein|tara:strand:- start:4046 stop:4744 length:699 start_codon:yes stop_codon:yes gene_type:complete
MAIQTVNIGQIANDGTGDDLREAFVKVNNNFAELSARSPEQTTGANLGASGEGIFAQISLAELQFKKIVAGSAITLASDANTVTINSTATGLPSVQVFADNNNLTLDSNSNALTIAGGGTTTTNLSGTTITVSSVTSVQTDTAPKLTATLNAQTNDITNVGNMTGLVHNLDIRKMDGIQSYVNELDLGLFNPESFSTGLEYLIHNMTVDFDNGSSTFTASAQPTAEFGTSFS